MPLSLIAVSRRTSHQTALAIAASSCQPPPSSANPPNQRQPWAAAPLASAFPKGRRFGWLGRDRHVGRSILYLLAPTNPLLESHHTECCAMHHFEEGRVSGPGQTSKCCMHHIACSLVKQRAEPWNLGEAASLPRTSLLPPWGLAPLSSQAPPLPSQSPAGPVQPSRPSSGSPPAPSSQCPPALPPSKVPSRSLRATPPPAPSPPAYCVVELCHARARLAPAPTPRLQHTRALASTCLTSPHATHS